MDRMNAAAPAFDAAYAAWPRSPRRPASDTIVTTRPHLRSTIEPSTAWVQLRTPYRLRSMNGFQSAGAVWRNGTSVIPPAGMPALFTSTSTGPTASWTAATIAATAAGSVTSAAAATARPPAAVIRSTTPAARSSVRSLTATVAPCAASVAATSAPTFWPPPVTSTTRSV